MNQTPSINTGAPDEADDEPCAGRVCSGSGCSHERASFELIEHDQAIGLYESGPEVAE